MLRSYVQGDDFVGSPNGTAPGQPRSAVNLRHRSEHDLRRQRRDHDHRRWTTLPAGITDGIVALQGKPLLPTPAGQTDRALDVQHDVRPRPDPDLPVRRGRGWRDPDAEQRRAVADTEQCLKCHVGSLYQHGNTRVDNVTMCIICHNSASSEQNNRVAMGVDGVRSVRRQGRPDLRVEDHAAHDPHVRASNGQTARSSSTGPRHLCAGRPTCRCWPNWAASPCEKATPTAAAGVLGLSDCGSAPTRMWRASRSTSTSRRIRGRSTTAWRAMTRTSRRSRIRAEAVATTFNAGRRPWANQLDDTLAGPATAACTTCHQSTDGGSCVPEWLDAADLRERSSDHPRCDPVS